MSYDIHPRLFVVGAAKSGTTSLVDYLNQHPQIYIPSYKEPCKFVDNFGCNEQEYSALYRGRKERVLVDASTPYLYAPESARAIASEFPEAKILAVLREPVSMAYSFWQYMSAIGSESLTFQEAISSEIQEKRRSHAFTREVSGWYADYLYLERARYSAQIKRYLDHYPKQQIKVFLFDDLVSGAADVCDDIIKWLDLEPYSIDVSTVSNEGGSARFGFVNKLRQKRYPLLKKVLPVQWRAAVRRSTRKFNLKSGDKTPIESALRVALMKNYKSEVEFLGEMIGRDLVKIWGYDAV